EKKATKKDKEREREKRKALISEPVGEVRHTCHLDKKELVPPAVSPSSVHTNGTSAQSHLSPSLSQVSSPVLLRSTGAREGITLRETMSLRDVIVPNKDSVAFREVVSPPVSRAPSQPPPSTSSQASPQLRPSVSPSAPPLTVCYSTAHVIVTHLYRLRVMVCG
ncbi:hypothetical protein GCK32_005380, partial [Trichostrongylus colubriformis]